MSIMAAKTFGHHASLLLPVVMLLSTAHGSDCSDGARLKLNLSLKRAVTTVTALHRRLSEAEPESEAGCYPSLPSYDESFF
jgi:hypothetical protein